MDKLFYRAQNPAKQTQEFLSMVTVKRDIPYSENFPDIKLDLLYRELPEKRRRPVFFYIHGGGFSAGDKRYRDCFCARVALESGAIVVNVNHPLGPEVTAPYPLRCLVEGANWVAHHADEYGFDLSRAIVAGDSSGAYYAAMLGMIPGSPDLEKIYGTMRLTFAGAVLSSGLYDLEYSLRHKLPLGITRGVCRDVTGFTIEEALSSELFPFINPIEFVTSAFPKSMVVYAERDFFAKGQAESFIERIREQGGSVEEYHSTGFMDNHAFLINRKSKAAREAKRRMDDFIKRFCTEAG